MLVRDNGLMFNRELLLKLENDEFGLSSSKESNLEGLEFRLSSGKECGLDGEEFHGYLSVPSEIPPSDHLQRSVHASDSNHESDDEAAPGLASIPGRLKDGLVYTVCACV